MYNATKDLAKSSFHKSYLKKLNKNPINSCYFMPITEEDVVNIVNKLKNKKSAGSDNIPIKLIKENIDVLKYPLTVIFNLSLSTGTFSNELKKAYIVPIFKKGDTSNVNNYRPISILSCISKILESIVKEQVVNYILIKKILTNNQFGFRKNCSTRDAIYLLIDKINCILEDQETALGIFCDLSKAFDCVDHSILLDKLEYYGFRGVTLKWFKSYLTERLTQVQLKTINNNNIEKIWSSPGYVKCGVPQGSILGPLLFLLYINDLECNFPEASFIFFADDTSILIHDPDKYELQLKGEKLIDEVIKWFNANKLILNIEKTINTSFNLPRQEQTVIMLQSSIGPISHSVHSKFLGVYIDNNLHWDKHIEEINKKLSKSVFALLTIKKNVGYSAARSVYFAYFNSILEYAIEFWGISRNVNTTFLLQKRLLEFYLI